LYVDGSLKTENHSLRVTDVLEVLGIEYAQVDADSDWLDKRGNLPDKLSRVKKYKPES
jgi:hypothetical protein